MSEGEILITLLTNEEDTFLTRGVMIPLFPGSGSGIGIGKRLRIQLWIRIQGWNHNTSIAVSNPLFPGSRSGIGIVGSPKKGLKSNYGVGYRAGIVTPLVGTPIELL